MTLKAGLKFEDNHGQHHGNLEGGGLPVATALDDGLGCRRFGVVGIKNESACELARFVSSS